MLPPVMHKTRRPPPGMTRRSLIQAVPALGLGLALPAARACEFQIHTLRVTHPWTRATRLDADHAVLCMRIDEVTADDRLIGARTPVAGRTEMSDGGPVDLRVPAGSEFELAEQGLHVRLLDLKHPLQVGRSYPLDLEFEVGGTLFASLSVDFTAMRFR